MRALSVLVLVALVAAPACTSTYHPEYHPVTVTTYEQHVGYPAAGAAPGTTLVAAPGATLSAPPPPQPSPPPPWSAWPSE